MIKLSYKPYILKLKHAFRISRGVRNSAPLMLVRLEFEGKFGYGEASMPVLYGESHETAMEFLSKVDLSSFKDPFEIESILTFINDISPGNQAIKAAIDIALHDLVGKLMDLPVHKYLGIPFKEHHTSMTIGIDTPEIMAKRAIEYSDFKYLKIKLGTANDQAMIEAIRSVSKQAFFIDANQGWTKKEEALDLIYWLKDAGAVFIEQPMPRENKQDLEWLTSRSPLPIIGDEGVQRLCDIKEAVNLYHGINIKLMKSTGIWEGFKMAIAAKAMGLKVMLGCMSETSCAISAASQLGALADWVDLDGNLDVENDPFKGTTVISGRLTSTNLPGIGLNKVSWESIPGLS